MIILYNYVTYACVTFWLGLIAYPESISVVPAHQERFVQRLGKDILNSDFGVKIRKIQVEGLIDEMLAGYVLEQEL